MLHWNLIARIRSVSVWTYNNWLLMRDESNAGAWLVNSFEEVMAYVDKRGREGWSVRDY